MDITNAHARPSKPGPPDYFTGSVRLEPLINAPDPARLQGVQVTFAPGARTAWHTHPLGQTLIVVSGTGLAQTDGGPVRPLNPGDVVWFAPGEKHWHGAAPNSEMVHIALQEAQDGVSATWLEHVSDADYLAAPAP